MRGLFSWKAEHVVLAGPETSHNGYSVKARSALSKIEQGRIEPKQSDRFWMERDETTAAEQAKGRRSPRSMASNGFPIKPSSGSMTSNLPRRCAADGALSAPICPGCARPKSKR
jgi:hypothetical protein